MSDTETIKPEGAGVIETIVLVREAIGDSEERLMQPELVERIEKLFKGVQEAHKIIEVLYMDALDNNGESWPRAEQWLEDHSEFKPTPKHE